MKILIVEDEPSLREIMYRALVQEHYVVETAATYADADAKVAGYSYDCILLDIMLPDGNGLRLLEHIKELRKRENVIIISARNSLEDKVLGLEQGADDYLPKPFHTAELLARIRSVLRRGRSGGDLSLSLGNVSLWPEGRRVEVEGRELALLKKEFDILLYFMQRPNHLVPRLDPGYQMDALLRVRNCLYAHYTGPMSYSNLASQKLDIYAFEHEIETTGDSYSVYVNQDDDNGVLDVFMETK